MFDWSTHKHGLPIMNKPLRVGITGGIGAGKSLICKIFQILGVPLYDADSRAKWLMGHDVDLGREIQATFGQQSFVNNELDRQYLAKLVFNNKTALTQLNGMVHPAVAKEFKQWVNAQNANYVMKEAALLIESGSYKSLDSLIVVVAPEPIRINRVVDRDPHRSQKDVQNIIANQISDTERIEHADYIIQNDESALIVPQVIQIHKELLLKK